MASKKGRRKAKTSRPHDKRRAHAFVASTKGAARSAGEESAVDSAGVRLNRWLAERGVASRRKADVLVQEAHVEINGEFVLEPGYRVQPGDQVRVDGEQIKDVGRLYYVFHKPKGVLCTDSDRERRPRVRDLVDSLVPSRVYTVGRLDEDSEGLILLTNDGDFANLVAHPRYGVPKTYLVTVSAEINRTDVDKLRRGVYLAEGKVVPRSVKVVKRSPRASVVEVVVAEGVNREIRRLFARIGFGVKQLKRVRIGSIGLRGVPRGALRPLTRAELDELRALAVGDKVQTPRNAGRRPAKLPKARRARRGEVGRRGRG